MQVLTNGIEVKLQRNALSVIEAPTGHEEDDEIECENMQWNASDMGEFFSAFILLSVSIPTPHVYFSLIFYFIFLKKHMNGPALS